MTVHNLAFQGWFPATNLAALRLPAAAFSLAGVEYFNGIGFLKAGLFYADRLTTVSPSYAREIQTPAGGAALDGLLRARAPDLLGILNGIDEEVWNPETDLCCRRPMGRSRRRVRPPARPPSRPASGSTPIPRHRSSASSAASPGRRGWTFS